MSEKIGDKQILKRKESSWGRWSIFGRTVDLFQSLALNIFFIDPFRRFPVTNCYTIKVYCLLDHTDGTIILR